MLLLSTEAAFKPGGPFLGEFTSENLSQGFVPGRPSLAYKGCGYSIFCTELSVGNGNKRERVEIPKMGALVATPLGEGKVVGINRGQHTASVKLAPDNIIQVEWDEIVDASQADNV